MQHDEPDKKETVGQSRDIRFDEENRYFLRIEKTNWMFWIFKKTVAFLPIVLAITQRESRTADNNNDRLYHCIYIYKN